MGSTLSTRPPSSANDKRLEYTVGGGFCASVRPLAQWRV